MRGQRVRCVLQDQHSICYNGVLQHVDINQAGPRARCVRRDQHSTIDDNGVPQPVDITHVAVLDPG